MEELGYKSWGLVPVDSDPASGVPSHVHPPMITTLALDPGASLVIELQAPPADLELQMRLTALSTEGESGSNMKLLTAATEAAFTAIPASWEKEFEGMDAVFTVRVSHPGQQLKIHSQSQGTLIVRTVSLARP